MTNLIVTAYFKIPSKKDDSVYREWIPNMLNIQNDMFIFCDYVSYDFINSIRKEVPFFTKIIVIKFKDFYTFRYFNIFKTHTKMDPETKIGHNEWLYMVWNEKSNFLKKAIESENGYTHYLWVDMGCFRTPKKFGRWPIGVPDRILLLEVESFYEWELNAVELPNFQHTNRIGGTIFGGSKENVLIWWECYYQMLEHFIKINRFIGKDQSIMNCVYLQNKELCELVKPRICPDRWFYLQYYLL